jgi:intein-encoded DNA endonuclease-like protein
MSHNERQSLSYKTVLYANSRHFVTSVRCCTVTMQASLTVLNGRIENK